MHPSTVLPTTNAPTNGIVKVLASVSVYHHAMARFAVTMVVAVPAGNAPMGRNAPPVGSVWRPANPNVQIKNVVRMVVAASAVVVPAMVIAPPMVPVLASPNVKKAGSVVIMAAAESVALVLRPLPSAIPYPAPVSLSAPLIVRIKSAVTMAVVASVGPAQV